jgi:hypothetical protein
VAQILPRDGSDARATEVITVADLLSRNAHAPVREAEPDTSGISVGALLRREGRIPHDVDRPLQPRPRRQATDDKSGAGRRALVRRGAIAAGTLLAAGSVVGAAILTDVAPTANQGADADGAEDDSPYPGQGLLDPEDPAGTQPGTVSIDQAAASDPLDPGAPASSDWVPVAFPGALAGGNAGTDDAATDGGAPSTGGSSGSSGDGGSRVAAAPSDDDDDTTASPTRSSGTDRSSSSSSDDRDDSGSSRDDSDDDDDDDDRRGLGGAVGDTVGGVVDTVGGVLGLGGGDDDDRRDNDRDEDRDNNRDGDRREGDRKKRGDDGGRDFRSFSLFSADDEDSSAPRDEDDSKSDRDAENKGDRGDDEGDSDSDDDGGDDRRGDRGDDRGGRGLVGGLFGTVGGLLR